MSKIIPIIDDDFELEKIMNLFPFYGYEYCQYTNPDYFGDILFLAVNRIYNTEAKGIIEQEQNSVFSDDDFQSIENNVQEKYDELINKYQIKNDSAPVVDPFEDIDVQLLISDNERADAEAEMHQDDWKDYEQENNYNDKLIDDLFSNFEK